MQESLRAASSSAALRRGAPILAVTSYAAAEMLDYREELRSWGQEAYGETREFLRDIYHIGRRADPQFAWCVDRGGELIRAIPPLLSAGGGYLREGIGYLREEREKTYRIFLF